ncbi:hypothetical protein PN36_29655 [Candidatus Thiomargarita nelsonii]|uniref:Uncharacterized protein n=1 Tax=Candidatus Thiomargarita nelsonii TaxID=1003181 RepID=A0A4E0QL71_9GAMM|nr:hypothetical protein PN36_29655 [Candidatus Thiomargarita nelsonii]
MSIKLFILASIGVITGGSLFTEMFKKHKILGMISLIRLMHSIKKSRPLMKKAYHRKSLKVIMIWH